MDPDIAAKLRAPFPKEAIGKLPRVTCPVCSDSRKTCENHKRQTCRTCKAYVSTKHIHLDYVGHAFVRERLLEVDREWNWEPIAINANGLPATDDHGGMWIRLTVGGITRLGYGHAASRNPGDAVKACISNAIRNAAQSFGVALDLWKKELAADEGIDDVPTRQVERPRAQSTEERRVELRGQIAAIGKAKSKSVDVIAAEFQAWSHGKEDITRAGVAVLAEYLDHIQRESA